MPGAWGSWAGSWAARDTRGDAWGLDGLGWVLGRGRLAGRAGTWQGRLVLAGAGYPVLGRAGWATGRLVLARAGYPGLGRLVWGRLGLSRAGKDRLGRAVAGHLSVRKKNKRGGEEDGLTQQSSFEINSKCDLLSIPFANCWPGAG
ncbi:hypothetical protein BY996DRAFT_6464822 [Phakopsora pachyrhizi]|nr:hypothetical protein BY996DRAFT_6464822 [Phakopsora pachyrhizi]